MTRRDILISAALAGLAAAGFAASSQAVSRPPDKCYGIAKAYLNNCAGATGAHSCKGQAQIDNDPGDFVLLAPIDCVHEGGKMTPPPAPPAQ